VTRQGNRIKNNWPQQCAEAEQINLIKEYINSNFTTMGMCADLSVQDKREAIPTRAYYAHHATYGQLWRMDKQSGESISIYAKTKEGLEPSEEVIQECRRVLNGEITHEQYH
jgi:hypothetical protein